MNGDLENIMLIEKNEKSQKKTWSYNNNVDERNSMRFGLFFEIFHSEKG